MRGRKRRIVLFAICAAVFLISALVLLLWQLRTKTEAAQLGQLAARVHTSSAAAAPAAADTNQPADAAPLPDAATAPVALSALAALQKENADLFGWLQIPGTRIDFPVMYTPDDPEYYLRRAFDGSYSYSGVPFVGPGYAPDGLHTILYGHNLKDGAMFADLLRYANQDFWLAHPDFTLDTPEASATYTVLAAFYARDYYQDETSVFRYYNYTDLRAEETYLDYTQNCRAAALYETNVTAAYGDRLLTLSTCSYHEKNGRFVVVAKLKSTG